MDLFSMFFLRFFNVFKKRILPTVEIECEQKLARHVREDAHHVLFFVYARKYISIAGEGDGRASCDD